MPPCCTPASHEPPRCRLCSLRVSDGDSDAWRAYVSSTKKQLVNKGSPSRALGAMLSDWESVFFPGCEKQTVLASSLCRSRVPWTTVVLCQCKVTEGENTSEPIPQDMKSVISAAHVSRFCVHVVSLGLETLHTHIPQTCGKQSSRKPKVGGELT